MCGITPYDQPHVGHARCYVVFDILKRFLQNKGFDVRHVQNYTDIDDKIIERAQQQKVTPADLAEKNIHIFEQMMNRLNITPADEYPRVTENMPAIVQLIEKLVQRGIAYEKKGSVYFSVRLFQGYGKLSKRNIDQLEEGARVEVDPDKKDPLDFALWKAVKPGEPSWVSPWGPGRPGWHIECSVMSMQSLGEEFDIHGGGQDLIFPHHENEIAQSEAATGKNFSRYWIHNGFVTINKEKMSKSLGNFFTLQDVMSQTDPMVLRYFLISQHYKTPLNFSDAELKAIETVWTQRIVGAYRIAARWEHESKGSQDNLGCGLPNEVETVTKDFEIALDQDLNTPVALGILNRFCTLIFELDKSQGEQLSREVWSNIREKMDIMLNILGLVVPSEESWGQEILDLVEERQRARANKNWAKSDRIRDELKRHGITIEDASSGPRLKRI